MSCWSPVYANACSIVTVCVFVCHMFLYHPFYFDFHSACVIFDVSSGFYFWNVNRTPTWHLSKMFKLKKYLKIPKGYSEVLNRMTDNGQMKRKKMTNNDVQKLQRKLRRTRTPLKTECKLMYPGRVNSYSYTKISYDHLYN
jgi:hypothetical protein